MGGQLFAEHQFDLRSGERVLDRILLSIRLFLSRLFRIDPTLFLLSRNATGDQISGARKDDRQDKEWQQEIILQFLTKQLMVLTYRFLIVPTQEFQKRLILLQKDFKRSIRNYGTT